MSKAFFQILFALFVCWLLVAIGYYMGETSNPIIETKWRDTCLSINTSRK